MNRIRAYTFCIKFVSKLYTNHFHYIFRFGLTDKQREVNDKFPRGIIVGSNVTEMSRRAYQKERTAPYTAEGIFKIR